MLHVNRYLVLSSFRWSYFVIRHWIGLNMILQARAIQCNVLVLDRPSVLKCYYSVTWEHSIWENGNFFFTYKYYFTLFPQSIHTTVESLETLNQCMHSSDRRSIYDITVFSQAPDYRSGESMLTDGLSPPFSEMLKIRRMSHEESQNSAAISGEYPSSRHWAGFAVSLVTSFLY